MNFTGNGYKTVQFHVQGSISDYTTNQIEIIKETVAAIVGCDNEEIHLNGFCKSTSFFVVLSIKEKYINSLFNMKQQDKEKLIGLNINYFIIDSDHVYLNNPKGNFGNQNVTRTLALDACVFVAASSFIKKNGHVHYPDATECNPNYCNESNV